MFFHSIETGIFNVRFQKKLGKKIFKLLTNFFGIEHINFF